MNIRIISAVIVATVGAAAWFTHADQESNEGPRPTEASEKVPDSAPPEGVALSQAELEKKFKEMLTGVVFRGTFQMTRAEGLKGKAPLSPPRTERYTIKSISKGLDDNWVITARIQYMDKDGTLPIPVRVVWAGDTPIITLDKFNVLGFGRYSARVMIYNGFYAGTWFGKGYGGILSGQIVKAEDEEAVKKLEARDKRQEARDKKLETGNS
ncbi:MAG: hypothetical protein ACE5EQ_06055 [Phycisphaerae bacterium]